MSLRIQIGGETLDEMPGFSLELDLLSPIFNDHGSQTSALSLPPTPRNQRLLGYPSRLDVKGRTDCRQAVLTDGPLRRDCLVNVLSASATSIEISIGTDESLMYDSWQDTMLRDIPSLPIYEPEGETLQNRIDAIIGMLDSVYRRTLTNTPFRIFPVALEFSDRADTDGYDAAPTAIILNELLRNDTKRSTGDLLGTSLKYDSRTLKPSLDSENLITVPAGYGVSPFLRVSSFLHILFSSFGYSLKQNVFDTDCQLSELVILNNTMDTICTGRIDYRDLLPSVTVNDFLESLRARFGAVFYLDSSTREARMVLLKDSLTFSPDLDLTLLHECRPKITVNSPQQLVLESQTGYLHTTTEEDSLDGFLSKYDGYIDLDPYASAPPVVFSRFTQSFLREGKAMGVYLFMSSLHYSWNPKDSGYEEYQITGKDQSIALYSYEGSADVQKQYIFNYYALPLYLSGVRNAHTAVASSSALTEDSTLEKDTDLAFCFAHGNFVTHDGYSFGLYYGSPYATAPSGQHYVPSAGEEYRYSLTFDGEDGAYNRFFREFDRMLRHSNREVEVTVRLDRSSLSLLDISRPKLFFGQKMMIDSYKLILPLSSHLSRSMTLRTLRSLDTADSVPTPSSVVRPNGYWLKTSNLSQLQTAILQDTRNVLIANNDVVEFKSFKWESYDRQIPSSIKLPTDEEIANETTKTFTYKIRLLVEYNYKNQSFILYQKGSGTYSSPDALVTETWTATPYSS